MPITYELYPERQLMHATFSGKVTDAEMIEWVMTFVGDPDWTPDFGHLVDARSADMMALSLSSLQSARDIILQYGTRAPRLAFVAENGLNKAVAGLYHAVYEGEGGREVQVFDSMGSAIDWLTAAGRLRLVS